MTLIPAGRRIEAVLFDLDGTLILSEDRTDAAVLELLKAQGIDPGSNYDTTFFHGVTWAASAVHLVQRWPQLATVDCVSALQTYFHQTFILDPPEPIPGAVQALAAAAKHVPVAIVTSSQRETLDLVCAQLGIEAMVSARLSADDDTASKPSPAPYQAAAQQLGLAPQCCLVFEDSRAGVRSGSAAGALVIAVGSESGHQPSIADYQELPGDFFAQITGADHG